MQKKAEAPKETKAENKEAKPKKIPEASKPKPKFEELADKKRAGFSETQIKEEKPDEKTKDQSENDKKPPLSSIKQNIKEAKKRRQENNNTPIKAAMAKKKEKEAAPQSEALSSLDGMFGVYNERSKNPKRKTSFADVARWVILFVCIFGFFFAGYFVFDKFYGYYKEEKLNKELQAIAMNGGRFSADYMRKNSASIANLTIYDIIEGKKSAVATTVSGMTNEDYNIIANLQNLKKINSDMAAWIQIEGTPVNYPVMWTKSKNFYLHRDFYKNYLASGTIYIDERNNADVITNRNTVMYGHNMNNGSMFSSIHDFKDYNVFSKKEIKIYTDKGIYVYTPFSVHESSAYDNYFETNFVNDSDYIDFCNTMNAISKYASDYKFTSESHIITLSTCANSASNDVRFVVHAVLTQIIVA